MARSKHGDKEYFINNFDTALENGWIKVYHQPIIRAANDLVSDEEALSRWEDPVIGFIMPSVFIPILEQSGLIHKLDLYVVEQIIAKMKKQAENGIFVVPESVNISKKDFELCDIVEEITTLMDNAGIGHDKLIVEISERAIGSDIENMKSGIERFCKNGFKVWMDDFGSGFSSPMVLQDISFDAIKLDPKLIGRLESGDSSKIILTELVKMACALGIETIAENVENAKQAEFLLNIGCTKLQGFHYCPPLRVEVVFDRFKTKKQIGYENPKESGYYTMLGRVSLYDLNISVDPDGYMDNYFDTMPMAIFETDFDNLWVTRANKPYTDFFNSSFPGYDMYEVANVEILKKMRGSSFCSGLVQCAKNGKKVIIDERAVNGLIMHILIRRIAVNPVTGVSAMLLAILGMNEGEDTDGLNYTYIAQALSSDYIDLFYVDIDTGNYIEYSSGDAYDDLAIERHGTDFFDNAFEVAQKRVFREDLDRFLESFTREKIEKALEKDGVFTLSYRICPEGEPIYVHMKIVPIKMKGNSIIIGISNITAQMKEQEAIERIKEENLTYSRLMALSENYVSIFIVDPDTDEYFSVAGKESATRTNEIASAGNDFYSYFLKTRRKYVAIADLEYVSNQFTKDNIIKKINEKGIFILKYRFVLNDELRYAVLKAAFIEEKGVKRLIIGIRDDTEETLRAQETERMLIKARNEANVDVLTGVKNKNAYNNIEKQINKMIEEGIVSGFALVVLDINEVKEVNDTLGHQAGDEYIKKGCNLICNIFRHCPVFRIGGDEFVAIVQGRSYQFIDKIMEVWNRSNQENLQNRDIVIAAGVARYDGEKKLEDVFAKADALMYENKRMLKGMK